MKKGRKLISFLLAFVLIVTAVPDNGIVSAQEVKAAQTEATQAKAAEGAGLVKWQPVDDDDENKVTVSEDQTEKATLKEYGNANRFYYSGTLEAAESSYFYSGDFEVNEDRVQEAVGVTGAVGTIKDSDFSYQWYEVDADGKRTELEGRTGRTLQITSPSYADEEDICVTNTEKEKTFVCVLTLELVRVGGSSYNLSELLDYEELVESGDLSIEHKVTLKYAGEVVGKSQISDYFYGVDNLKDEKIAVHYKKDYDEYGKDTLRVSGIGREDWYASYFNYSWTVHYMDGSEELLSEKTHQTSIDTVNGSLFSEDKKQIDYYECEIDLCYGYQVIDTVSKKIFYRYEPFYFDGDAEVTKHIRKNATVEMDVDAEIADTDAVVPGSLAYQWYEIDAKGNEKKLKNETASSYTVRVPDPSMTYKVEVTAKKQKDFEGPEFDEVLTRTFRFTSSDGYLLKDICQSSYSMNIGDTQKLYVEPKVDGDYKLEYKWEKAYYEKDEDGNYVYEEDGLTRKIAYDEVGKSKEYEVKPKDVSDFETIRAYDGENNQSNYNYRVTVTVKEDGEVVDKHVYTFRISEDISYEVVEESDSKLSLNPGDDLELYVKADVKDCYTLEQTWYKKAGEGIAAAQAAVETGEVTYISLDEEEFEIPKKYDWVEQGDFEGYYEIGDGEYANFYRYTFWEQVADGATYTEKGMKSGKVVDVRGKYKCRLEMYRAGEKDAEDEETEAPFLASATRTFTVSYDSDLSAYAKSLFPTVKEGEKAKLRIVAQTKSNAYKIHYKWEKLGTDDKYKEIEDIDSPVYEIKKATSEDAGQYRVTVTDEYDGTCSPIYIWLSVQKGEGTGTSDDVTHICYTPSQSTYELGIGQKVNLKLDMKLSDPKVDVFYAWYRNEKVSTEDGWGNSYKENWELLGEDKNTYKLEVKGEDDFTTYKCMAVYRKNDTEYAKAEVRFHVRQGYTAELEKMTVSDQIKKRGDSASYTVRLITDDPDLSVKYQWYREDGTEISGATKETYEVAELKQGDFGRIYCVATDSKTGERVAQRAYFTTRIYRNGAYLEKNNETVEATIGDVKTVLGAPVIERGEGLELTYQWYRESTIIYGATAPTYTIEEIGDNEFVEYRCEIFADGDFLANYYTTVVEKEEDGDEEKEELITVSVAEGYETNVKAFLGSSAKFAVTAESKKELALRYQWYYSSYGNYDEDDDGYAIGGATESTYEIPTVTSSKKGYYYCIVMDEEGNQAYSDRFFLTTTTGLEVETEGYYTSDAISVQTSFGAQDVVLTATATASTEHGYTPFYQWYHETMDDKGLIYGANTQTLTLPTIDEDALGMYYCTVKDSSGADYTLKYYVYVNNGLNVVPSTYHVLTEADGSAKMYVTATANEGCEISYQWSKYGKDEDGEYSYIDIEGATQSTFVINPLKSEDYGSYRCKISTVGERNYYGFSIQPDYMASIDRDFAGQGDQVTVMAELENPASDLTYSYQWYEQDPATRTYRKVKDGTETALSKAVPAMDLSEQFTQNDKLGYVTVGYRCVITIGEGEDESQKVVNTSVRVLPDFTYQSDAYPETNHPNDKSFDLQAYRADGAQQLKITFDAQTELGSTAGLYLIDNKGKYEYYSKSNEDELAGQTITVSGDSIVLLMNGNQKANAYGYKVSNIEAVYPPQPSEDQPGGANTQPGSAVTTPGTTATEVPAGSKAVVKKGNKYTVKNLKYKVTSATAKKKTVTVIGGKSKKLTSVTIPATVKISGASYKVTAISAKAFQGYSKLKSVTIGKNVKSIGANAFAKDKKLKSITVKGTVLKSIGKKAFANVPKKAAVKAPKKSKKAYKKLFKKGAFKGKVK